VFFFGWLRYEKKISSGENGDKEFQKCKNHHFYGMIHVSVETSLWFDVSTSVVILA